MWTNTDIGNASLPCSRSSSASYSSSLVILVRTISPPPAARGGGAVVVGAEVDDVILVIVPSEASMMVLWRYMGLSSRPYMSKRDVVATYDDDVGGGWGG